MATNTNDNWNISGIDLGTWSGDIMVGGIYTYMIATYNGYGGTVCSGYNGGNVIILPGIGGATNVWVGGVWTQQTGQQCDPPNDTEGQMGLPFGSGNDVEDPKVKNEGMSCSDCLAFSEYGEPNQESGAFICYACRHNL